MLVPALLAAALCVYQLDSRSLWLDEAASFSIASQHGAALGSALARDGGNLLGYYALLHVLISIFGSGTVVLRLPSVIAAAVAAGIVAALARRLWGARTGLVAGVLSAVSLTLVYWGQDARGYAPMIALISASFLALTRLLQEREQSRGAWLLYVAVSVAAVYASLESLLVLAAQLLVILWYRLRGGRVIGALVVIGACSVPLLILAAERGSSQLFWVPGVSWRTAKQILDALASSGLQPGYYVSTGNALLILTGALVLFGAWRALAARPGRDCTPPGALLALSWLFVPFGLVLVISLLGHSIFQARYLLVSLPAVPLLLAWTLSRGGLPRTVALAALAAVLVLRALALAPSYGVSAERWDAATAYVESAAAPRDCIAFYPLDARMPFEYYGGPGHRLPRPVLPALRWGVVRPYVEQYRTLGPGALEQVRAECTRVWLVSSHEGRLGGPPVSGANFRRLAALEAALARFYPRSGLRRFGHASPISIRLFTGAA